MSYSALLTGLVEATRERLGAAACSIAVLDGVDGGELEFRAASGAGAAEVLGMRIPVGRGIAGWVVASGQSIAVSDVERDRRFDRATAENTGYVPRSILAVPVEGDDGPLGVLEVLDRAPGPHDTSVAGAAAAQAALILELERAHGELADPALAGIIGQARRLGPAHRGLAAALLAAVLAQEPVSR